MSRSNLAYFALALFLCFSASNLHAATIAGVTIEDFSSQLVVGPFSRGAVRTVDGSGWTGTTHTNSPPDGTMWLSTGTGAAGGTPDPNQPGAVITFDLGANYALNSMHVWNYNEVANTDRAARQVELLAADSVGGPFTSYGVITLLQPSGGPVDPGELVNLAAFNLDDVRLLRFNILNSYNGDAGFVGLSEIRFDGAFVPEPSTIVLWSLLGAVAVGSMGWRSRRRLTGQKSTI